MDILKYIDDPNIAESHDDETLSKIASKCLEEYDIDETSLDIWKEKNKEVP